MLSKISFFKKPTTSRKIETQGFTLIESLMGVLVISVVAVTITPPIVISTATRVQNRRAEQAMQIAQSETDRIRVFVEQGGAYTVNLPPAFSGTITGNNIATVAAPTTFVVPPVAPTLDTNASRSLANASTKAFGVDIDNDAKADYYVQLFRDNDANGTFPGLLPNSPADDTLVAFQLGVRVYSKVARVGSLQTPPEVASLQFTTSSGSQQFRPLAVVYTTVVRSDAKISFDRYKQYLTP